MSRIPLPKRQLILVLTFFLACILTYFIIDSLALLRNTIYPEVYLTRIAICLAGFLFPVFGGWLAFKLPGAASFAVAASGLVLLVGNISRSPVFVWFIAEYAALCFLLYRSEESYENRLAVFTVDSEKHQNEKNDLAVSYSTKGEGISIFFEKYSTYYHLRKMAEELTTTLSVAQVAQKVVNRTVEFISRGDIVQMALGGDSSHELTVVAYRAVPNYEKYVSKYGDLFDDWVVRNHKRLIVADTHQDFRFDIKKTIQQEIVRSLIAVPILHEGRVTGTLRINSARREIFTNDDLRLLDAIGALASSAISNAKLYERTEELAIRDSLTGLYVRRHFFERLKQEHRRALITKRPLSLLMCDLDHFKECNDRFGHGAGDLMLIRLAELLRKCTGDAIVARYGGEEFAVLLPEETKEEAMAVAETIRACVEKGPFMIRREKIVMTVSVGVASIPEDTLDIQMLVDRADQALYQAKRSGRNRVC